MSDDTETGRRLASQREDLIAAGADPADLLIPLAPADDTETQRVEVDERTLRHIGHLIDEAQSIARFQCRDTRDAMGRAAIDAVLEALPAARAVGDDPAAEVERLRDICAAWKREHQIVCDDRDALRNRLAAEVADREAQIKAEHCERIAQAIEAARAESERTSKRLRPWDDRQPEYLGKADAFEHAARIARAAALTDPTPGEEGRG